MSDSLRIYYYFIFGAFGGLNGWFLASILIPETNRYTPYGNQAIYGALLGASVSGTIAAHEGISARSFVRFIKFGCIGLLLGAFAGGVSLTAAQTLYSTVLAKSTLDVPTATASSIAVGMLCWILFGGLIGFGEGLRKGTQSYKGLLGGMLGGLAGGLLYEIGRVSNITKFSPYEQQIFLALTLALLGGTIGASIAFVSTTLKSAWIEVLNGKFAGHTYDVTKYVNRHIGAKKPGIIGSDKWSADIYLPADHEIWPRHAEISYNNGTPTLKTLAEAEKIGTMLVNGRRVTRVPLKDGDRLQAGSTMLLYRHTRK